VVLVRCGGLLGDLIRDAVARKPDIAVVADVGSEEELRLVVPHPDIVILHAASGDDFLGGRPELFTPDTPAKVFAATDHGRTGALWELRPVRTRIGELSPGLLIDTIRAAGR
jgi:hypothetical protein